MLGIILALPEEINNLLKEVFKNKYTHLINNKKFYIIKTINEQSVIITFSGVGKANAASTCALLINNFKIDKCINIGSCGGLLNVKPLDILLIDRTTYGDVDVTAFGYEINQVPKMPSYYATNENLNNSIIKILSLSNYEYKLGYCYTCDSFVNKSNFDKFNINLNSNIISGVDMECCAIAQVCTSMNIKFSAIKIISDTLESNAKSEKQFNDNITKIAEMIDTLTYNIVQAISYEEENENKNSF